MRSRRPLWYSGRIPDRSGLSAFTEVIRADSDPERSPRGSHGPDSPLRWRKDLKGTPAVWGERISALLKDRKPRTLNGISVELVDFTADMTFGTALAEALWALVEAEAVGHSREAPVYFTWLREPSKPPDWVAAQRRVKKRAG